MELLYIFITCFVLQNMFTEILFELKLAIKFKPFRFLIDKLNCLKCLCFWSTLILTGNLYFAAIVSFIAIMYMNVIEPLIKKLK